MTSASASSSRQCHAECLDCSSLSVTRPCLVSQNPGLNVFSSSYPQCLLMIFCRVTGMFPYDSHLPSRSGLPFAMLQEPAGHSDDESSLISPNSETSPPSSGGSFAYQDYFYLAFTILDASSSTDSLDLSHVFQRCGVEPDEKNTTYMVQDVLPATSMRTEVNDQVFDGRVGRDVNGFMAGGKCGGADIGTNSSFIEGSTVDNVFSVSWPTK
ncbi:uncharacterized protein BT62DRAFT_195690 [Guyanagaster necrorhizus]|uniref:Uncharacterized protein n=1 Tax=Guyanagaster necrorhizus TaxID=856835 RepID=A0A9P7VQC2_9AGAR|nr:uncharacterized protein BT62DRAFT_195690 [Guyanagaster necrorhizus MCA 3950]KAG7445468.1 hypothetical protein BT62DRAFT_195690 [Guyanagaster necrorhizus MCA 3950]